MVAPFELGWLRKKETPQRSVDQCILAFTAIIIRQRVDAENPVSVKPLG